MPNLNAQTDAIERRSHRSIPYAGTIAWGVVGLFVERMGSASLRKRYQTARLRALLYHAYENVSFYRRRFDEAGFHPDQFHTLDDLQLVPITRKADIRLATDEEAIAKDCDASLLYRLFTGGSTGEPTRLRFTRYEDRLLRTFRLLAMMRFGLRWRDRRSQVRMDQAPPGRIDDSFFLPSQTLHAFLPQEEMRANLRQFKPDMIRGYPSVLALYAEQITDEDRLLIRPRFVTTDSEVLTELARERLEEAFHAPVYDVYDCYECNVIAYECPHRDSEGTRNGGYHLMDTSVVVEVLREEQPVPAGESGEIALTSLHAWAAPLIRYLPGDVVERGGHGCGCGASNATLAKVFGRTHDMFLLPDGRLIHPKYLTSPMRPLMSVLRLYQIVQERSDCVVVKLQSIPGACIDEKELTLVREKMQRMLGDRVTVSMKLVDEIPSEANGKFRPYRSCVEEGAGK